MSDTVTTLKDLSWMFLPKKTKKEVTIDQVRTMLEMFKKSNIVDITMSHGKERENFEKSKIECY